MIKYAFNEFRFSVLRFQSHDLRVRRRVYSENKHVDYLISCLPIHVDFAKEYGVKVKEVLPFALDKEPIVYKPLEKNEKGEKVTILHAPTNRIFKGTKYIEQAIEELQSDGYNIELRLVECVKHEELLREYENCDIFIDQISIGWYGTAPLEAMAVGRPSCAFIDVKYYQYIDYAEEIPVVNISNENVTKKLRKLLDNIEGLHLLGYRSRKFVEKYHDLKNVSRKLKNIYQEKVWGAKQ